MKGVMDCHITTFN